jgi:hypothetical protein
MAGISAVSIKAKVLRQTLLLVRRSQDPGNLGHQHPVELCGGISSRPAVAQRGNTDRVL